MLATSSSVTEPVIGVQTVDLLIHIYSTQFKNEGLGHAIEVFSILASEGIFPSLKTCTILLTSLVRANEVQKAIEVFGIMCRGVVFLLMFTCLVSQLMHFVREIGLRTDRKSVV